MCEQADKMGWRVTFDVKDEPDVRGGPRPIPQGNTLRNAERYACHAEKVKTISRLTVESHPLDQT